MVTGEMKPSTFSETTIDLKALLRQFWQDRVLIVLVFLAVSGLSCIYAFVIAKPNYQVSSSILLHLPASATTIYGEYVLPSNNINDYSQFISSNDLITDLQLSGKYNTLTKEQLESSLAMAGTKDSSLLQLTVTHENPQLAHDLNRDLIQLFSNRIRMTLKKNALDYFTNDVETRLVSLDAQILKNKALLSGQQEILQKIEPTFVLKKALLSDPDAAASYAQIAGADLELLSDNVLSEEFLVGVYNQQQIKVVETENALISLQQSYASLKNWQNDLREEQQAYQDKSGTPAQAEWLGGSLDILADRFIILSNPSVPEDPIAPHRTMSVAIGAILGLMLGLLISFSKSWWRA